MVASRTAMLRLGVMGAVSQDNRLLLSRRGDLNVWALPGGRLDAGERLADAAAREVEEETGLTVRIGHPIGMYYLAGWRRLNVLYAARPVGGALRATNETSESRYFSISMLPEMPLAVIAEDAAAFVNGLPRGAARTIVTPRREMRRLKMRLGLRYAMNALRGRPEPKFPRFDVSASAVIWNEPQRRVLTLRGRHELRALPRLTCHGDSPPWQQLYDMILDRTGLALDLVWAGLWQDARRRQVEFVFRALSPNVDLFRAGEWSSPRNAALDDRDLMVAARAKPVPSIEPIWTIDYADPTVQPGDTLKLPR